MNNLDLRYLGKIMDLPLYVDVSSVKDYKAKNDIFSERDKKALMVGTMIKRAFEMSDEKLPEYPEE